MTSLYTGSVDRHNGRMGSPRQEEDVLQGVEEVAVMPSCRLSTPSSTALPTSFSSEHGTRGQSPAPLRPILGHCSSVHYVYDG